jgi:hypothetical protein
VSPTVTLALLIGSAVLTNPVIEDVRKIPLESIYSTSGQQGMQYLTRRLDQPYGPHLQEIYDKFKCGASTLFLVRGKDIAAAARAARRVLAGYREVDRPVATEAQAEVAPLWLVVYLGPASGSTPPRWWIEGVEVKGQVVRLTFSNPKPLWSTGALHQHFLWVPLGTLKAGTYTLELFDADKKEVVLSRRVTAAEK